MLQILIIIFIELNRVIFSIYLFEVFTLIVVNDFSSEIQYHMLIIKI